MKILALALLAAAWHTDQRGPAGSIAFTATANSEIAAVVDVENLGEGIRYAAWNVRHYHIPHSVDTRGSSLLYGHGDVTVTDHGLVHPDTVIAWVIKGDVYAGHQPFAKDTR